MWYHPEYSVDKDTGRVHNSPNGFYKNGEIWVDINAGGNGEGLILFTVSHELVHFMRDFAPDHFDSFAKSLFDNYAKEGMSIRKAVHREMISHTNLKYDEAYEEVVARLSEAFLRDAHLTDKSRELYKTDKTVWEKIRDGLKDIVNRIARYYKGLSPESDLGKYGERLAKQSQEILDRFVAGVRAASDNAAYMKNTTDDGGVRMMDREEEYSDYNKLITAHDISVLHDIGEKKGRLSVVAFSNEELKATRKFAYQLYNKLGVKFPFFRAWFGDWRANEKRKRNAITPATQQIKNAGKAVNKDTQLTISWGDTFFKETAGHQWKNDLSMNLRSKIKQIIEESVYLNTRLSTNDSKSKMPYTALMHDFYFIAQEGDNHYLYKFYVEEALSNNKKTVFNRAYQIKSIEKIADITSGVHPKGSLTDVISTTTYTIADLYKYVNEYDEDFNPKSASKVVNSDGKPLVVYHGSGENFDEFDITKSRSWDLTPGLDLPGFYFSENPEEAGSYGEDIKGYYLSITNPYEGNVAVLAKEKGSYRAAYEYLVSEGYDGMIVDDLGEGYQEFIAFKSEQIKSVDNIGTFDRENPKYRYDSRDGDLFWDDDLSFGEYDDIADVVKRNYTTHSEAIGEVLKNTADIDIAPGKVYNIVARILDGYNIDTDTKKKLANQLHIELENAKTGDPEKIVHSMIDSVRGVLDEATERAFNDTGAGSSVRRLLKL